MYIVHIIEEFILVSSSLQKQIKHCLVFSCVHLNLLLSHLNFGLNDPATGSGASFARQLKILLKFFNLKK
jgi:hypothetical protein